MRDWDADKAMCDKATEGPWESSHNGYKDTSGVECEDDLICVGDFDNRINNFDFIAQAREALPYWLNEYRKVSAEVGAMLAILKKYQSGLCSSGELMKLLDSPSGVGQDILNRLEAQDAEIERLRGVIEFVYNPLVSWEVQDILGPKK